MEFTFPGNGKGASKGQNSNGFTIVNKSQADIDRKLHFPGLLSGHLSGQSNVGLCIELSQGRNSCGINKCKQ